MLQVLKVPLELQDLLVKMDNLVRREELDPRVPLERQGAREPWVLQELRGLMELLATLEHQARQGLLELLDRLVIREEMEVQEPQGPQGQQDQLVPQVPGGLMVSQEILEIQEVRGQLDLPEPQVTRDPRGW